MLLLRKLTKGAHIAWTFVYFLSVLALTRPKSRRDRAAWLSRICGRVLQVADITWTSQGPVPEHGAVITNHLSYLDILVHAALRPCVFVSAIETRRMPLIGWMSMMAGTVYVTRGAGGSAAQAAGGMAEGFRDGLPVVFFPEGRTGVGDVPVLPLHGGLLANALEVRAPVTAGFLRYDLADTDRQQGRSSRDDVAWGEQTLPAHLWNLLGLRPFHATIEFASTPIPFTAEAYGDRRLAVEQAQAALEGLAGTTL